MAYPSIIKMPDLSRQNLSAFERLTLFFASGFGAGYAAYASGTVASAMAFVPYMALHALNRPSLPPAAAYLAILAVVFVAGVRASTHAESILREKDPHYVTIDEFIGQWVALFLVPISAASLITGFFLFRLFDVWKPWPVRQSQSLPNGMGIMIDDVLAGIYACAVLHVIFRIVL